MKQCECIEIFKGRRAEIEAELDVGTEYSKELLFELEHLIKFTRLLVVRDEENKAKFEGKPDDDDGCTGDCDSCKWDECRFASG